MGRLWRVKSALVVVVDRTGVGWFQFPAVVVVIKPLKITLFTLINICPT
jgi:hypothetical protein